MERFKMQHGLPYAAVLILLSCVPLRAQDPTQGDPRAPAGGANESANPDVGSDNDDSGWLRAWMRIEGKARASQPHFVAPLVTTHVMLVQQFRYDMSWQQDPGGAITSNYGNSRGLEIIPSSRLEVGIFPPSYIVHQTNAPHGFGDFSYQGKFRAFSGTEAKGHYF